MPNFQKFDKDVEKELMRLRGKAAENLKKELQLATPIDTGLAAASWEVSETIKAHQISNSVPYIQYLNQGTSKQAPAYFVERTALQYGTPVGTIVQVK